MSVVDKAANKRKWLMCKRDGGQPGEDEVKLPDELTKLMGDLKDLLKGQQARPANDSPAGPTLAAFEELAKSASGLATQVADLTKGLGELKVVVDKQAETITAQAADMKKAAESAAATEKTIGDLRTLVNEQAEIIKKARLVKTGNSKDDDEVPHHGDERPVGSGRWPADLNEGRSRA